MDTFIIKNIKHNKRKIHLILLFNLFVNNNYAIADNVEINHFSPNIHFSGINSKYRNISEIDLMLPIIQNTNSLILADLKLKNDDKKSSEYNIGLAYRHNISDKMIFGVYNYFDRRITASDLYINQWTVGFEILNNYIDGRFNIYIPQNKKKIIKPSTVEFVRDRTKIYARKKGAIEESALPGYDVEFGAPVFNLLPHLNEKLSTKFYVARYYFQKKGIAKNIGTRLRIEQPLFNSYFNKRNSEIIVFAGSSKTNQEKWNHFAGFSLRLAIGKNSANFTKTGLKKRMMDNIVRDVDIVISSYQTNTTFVPLYWGDQLVTDMYFVGITNNKKYVGNGTSETPFTKEQFEELKKSKKLIIGETDIVIPIKMDKELEAEEYNKLINECSILNYQQKQLTHLHAESTFFPINQYFPNLYETKAIISDPDHATFTLRPYEKKYSLDHFIAPSNNISRKTKYIKDNDIIEPSLTSKIISEQPLYSNDDNEFLKRHTVNLKEEKAKLRRYDNFHEINISDSKKSVEAEKNIVLHDVKLINENIIQEVAPLQIIIQEENIIPVIDLKAKEEEFDKDEDAIDNNEQFKLIPIDINISEPQEKFIYPSIKEERRNIEIVFNYDPSQLTSVPLEFSPNAINSPLTQSFKDALTGRTFNDINKLRHNIKNKKLKPVKKVANPNYDKWSPLRQALNDALNRKSFNEIKKLRHNYKTNKENINRPNNIILSPHDEEIRKSFLPDNFSGIPQPTFD